MPRKQRSPETIIHKLSVAEILISQGRTVKEAAKRLAYCRRKPYSGMVPNQARLSGTGVEVRKTLPNWIER
jgi:hypothetical protein